MLSRVKHSSLLCKKITNRTEKHLQHWAVAIFNETLLQKWQLNPHHNDIQPNDIRRNGFNCRTQYAECRPA